MRDKDNVLVSSIVCLKLPFSMTNTLGAAENINYRTRKNFKDDSILPDSLLQNTKVELLRKKNICILGTSMASMPVERQVCLKINTPPTWETWPRRTASKSEAVAHKARVSGAHSKERASEREIRTCTRPCGWNIGGSVKALPTDRPLNTDKTPHPQAYKQPEQVVIV